jgi:pyruvate/2-oxoglutarate dehydrogenase complex dihydrolipoamide dehydrogenase (E3) component
MTKQYDAIIIGSGQAGNPLAHKLADLGQRVALIEKEHLGGSCVNYGCTPTKTMVASARIAHYARRAADFGVSTGPVQVDLAQVVARKNEVVQQWRSGQEKQVAQRPTLDLYRGHGRFTGPHTIVVNEESLSADRIFINTGTRPRLPDLPGLDKIDYLTNRTILDLIDLPDHLIILGGGYIGLEFGQMFHRFGSRVTIIETGEQLIDREDADVATALYEALQQEGIQFHLETKVTGVGPTSVGLPSAGLTLSIEKKGEKSSITGSHLLVAAGRTPNTDNLNLAAAGVEIDKHGYIQVNEKLETSAAGLYALGDVKGGPAFTHVSYDDHLIVYDNLIEGQSRTTSDRVIPYALFTDPELGRVGLTEKAARAAGYTLKVGKIPMASVARAIERDETAGLMKIVIDAETDRILGAAILGIEGGELVQILMAMMWADVPWTLLQKGMYIHPTLAEGFFALMDTIEVSE